MKNQKNCNTTKWHNKPYNFFGDYLRQKYSHRVLKLPINVGMSCPNRKLDSGGCIFCSEDGSASPASQGTDDLLTQMDNARLNFKRSDQITKYIAYFQAYTNTYGSINYLKKMYDTALSYPETVGMMIGTRPDALQNEKVKLIGSYKTITDELWVEIGMQSMHDKSLIYLNRNHSYKTTREAICRTADAGIDVCVHLILGIPGETWTDIMRTADEISSLPVRGVKFHHLHVINNTPLAVLYNENKVPLLGLKEYASILCDFIERLRKDIIIHRLAGDREEKSLIAPRWGLHKGTVINTIESQFLQRQTCQGFLIDE